MSCFYDKESKRDLFETLTVAINDAIKFGSSDCLWSFFSAIAVNLENGRWGSRFPMLMNNYCYQMKVELEDLDKLKEELKVIKFEFQKLASDKIVLDYVNLELTAKEDNLGIKFLDDVDQSFVTASKKVKFTDLFLHAIEACKQDNVPLELAGYKFDNKITM